MDTTTLALAPLPETVDPAPRRLLDHYRAMVLIRAFEVAAEEQFRAGHILGMTHSAVGQEAVAVGVCANLRRTDLITSTHRNHHHALAKGVDPTAAMAELLGRATGVCGGKGGSMHIADFSVGMLGANGVVAASAAIAAGAVQGLRLLGSDAIAAAFFGDGGINRGQCLEALNYAAVYQLPVLFVCEDNKWSATTRASTVTAGPGVAHRAEAFGIPAVSVNGNDVEDVDNAAQELVHQIRDGGGPRLLHCRTYRLRGHTVTDAAPYRDVSEVERHEKTDPIRLCAMRLEQFGFSKQEVAAAGEEEEKAIEDAVARALAAPWPCRTGAFQDVQDAGAPVSP